MLRGLTKNPYTFSRDAALDAGHCRCDSRSLHDLPSQTEPTATGRRWGGIRCVDTDMPRLGPPAPDQASTSHEPWDSLMTERLGMGEAVSRACVGARGGSAGVV